MPRPFCSATGGPTFIFTKENLAIIVLIFRANNIKNSYNNEVNGLHERMNGCDINIEI